MRRLYYWSVAGIAGFGYGQGVIVMWPEWSAWTWWGLATAMLPLLLVPTLWDRRRSIAAFFGIRRKARRVIADMTHLIEILDHKPTGIHDRYHQINRIAILCDRYPEWFPEDIDVGEIRDRAHSIIGSIERETGRIRKS